MRLIVVACACAALLSGVAAAAACEGTTQLLSDPFVVNSPTWSATTDFKVGNGTLSIAPTSARLP